MPADIVVIGMREKVPNNGIVINTCNNKPSHWESGFSPFLLGPCQLYGEFTAMNVENAWQYAKVYKQHADEMGNPADGYWIWAKNGWANPKAVRYPMGRGKAPMYSFWDGEKLDYIAARKRIYVPLFAEAVTKTKSFDDLVELYESKDVIYLRDWDGYRHVGRTLAEVLNNPRKKMGHAFVLAMLLMDDEALKQCELRE